MPINKSESLALVAAFTAMLTGVIVVVVDWDPAAELLVGLILVLIGAMTALTTVLCARVDQRTAEAHDHFERGVSIGHARGYKEGRRGARPVVVEAFCPGCGEQLGRQAG